MQHLNKYLNLRSRSICILPSTVSRLVCVIGLRSSWSCGGVRGLMRRLNVSSLSSWVGTGRLGTKMHNILSLERRFV